MKNYQFKQIIKKKTKKLINKKSLNLSEKVKKKTKKLFDKILCMIYQ